jgi:hypothetical protein
MAERVINLSDPHPPAQMSLIASEARSLRINPAADDRLTTQGFGQTID